MQGELQSLGDDIAKAMMNELENVRKLSVKDFLKREMVLDYVELYFKDETNLAIAKALYILQRGSANDKLKISLKKLSEVSKIGEDAIRENLRKNGEFLPLILDYIKDRYGEWARLTSLGVGYLEEEKMVDPYRYGVFP